MSIFVNAYRGFGGGVAPPVFTELFFSHKSLSLDGVNQNMTVADSDSLTFGNSVTDSPFSLSAWINPNTATNFYIVNKAITTSTREYSLYLDASGRLTISIYDLVDSNRIGRIYNATLDDNVWNHVSMTYDGSGNESGIKLYLNGVRVDDTTNSSGSYTAMHNTGSDVEIGSLRLSSYSDGKVASLLVWDKELSIDEVKESVLLKDYSQHSASDNIVSWWEFDDSVVSGTTVFDNIGSNNGTLNNSPERVVCIPFPYSYQLIDTSTFTNIPPNVNGSTSSLVPYGGYSWSFNGVNSFIRTPANSDISFGNGITDSPFSISTNIKFNTLTNGIIFSNSNEYNFFILSTGRIYLDLYNQGATSIILRGNSGPILADYLGSWINITATYSGDKTTRPQLYLNGESITTNSFNNGYTGMLTNQVFSNTISSSSLTLDAEVGDVVIIAKELSDDEIQEIASEHSLSDLSKSSFNGDIVAYYRGYNSTNTTNGVLDLSGNGNHGTPNSMTDDDFVYEFPRKLYNFQNKGSLTFNGTSQYLVSDSTLASYLSTGVETSISIWFKTDNSSTTTRLLRVYENNNNVWGVYMTAAGAVYCNHEIFNVPKVYRTSTTWNDGNWHNLVVVFTSGASNGYIFIDGEEQSLVFSPNNAPLLQPPNGVIYVGQNGLGSSYYDGQQAQISIVKKRLSQCELDEMYNDGSPVDMTKVTFSGDVINCWVFDQSSNISGGTVVDLIGNNNLTPTNMSSSDITTTDYPTN